MNGLVLPPDLRPGRVSAGTFPVVSAVPPSTDATDGSAAVPPQESGRPKGRIQAGADGDILLMRREDLSLDTVLSMGRVMMKHGEIQVRGTYE